MCSLSSPGEESAIHFGPLRKKDIHSVDEVEEGVYCRPSARNFAAVDALIAPDKLFQITIAENHGINVDGLIKMKDKLNLEGEIRLHFVIPKERYRGEQFKEQRYMTGGGCHSPLSILLIITECGHYSR